MQDFAGISINENSNEIVIINKVEIGKSKYAKDIMDFLKKHNIGISYALGIERFIKDK